MQFSAILSLFLSTTSAVAQSDPSEVARVTAQAFNWRWHTDWTTSYCKSRQGFDSTITVESVNDSSTFVWRYRPPEWLMLLQNDGRYGLDQSIPYPSPRAFFRYYNNTTIPGTVVITDWHRPTVRHRYYRARLSKLLIDSSDYSIRYRMDSTFDAEGKVRQVLFDSNAVHRRGDTVMWSHGKLVLKFDGMSPWLARSEESGDLSILTRDALEKQIITILPRPISRTHTVIDLPAGYRESALKLGPKFDSIFIAEPGKPLILKELEWIKLPAPETLKLLEAPYYILDGRLLASYVRIDSNRKDGKLDFDTVIRRFDAEGRLTFEQEGRGEVFKKYTYDERGNILEKDWSYEALRGNRERTSYVYSDRGQMLARYRTEIKQDRWKGKIEVDSTQTRALIDHKYRTFDQLGRAIESISTVMTDDLALSVVMAKDLTTSVSALLTDLAGKRLARSESGSISLRNMTPGLYQLRYTLDGRPMYDKTIAIDKR